MVDKQKGKQVACHSDFQANNSGSMNVAKTSSQCGETYTTKEQPLCKEIQVVTKDISSGGGNVSFFLNIVKVYLLILTQGSKHTYWNCHSLELEDAKMFQ